METRRAVEEFETKIDLSFFDGENFCLRTFHEKFARRTALAACGEADALCRKFSL